MGIRRRMSRLCRFEVRNANEKTLLLLGLINDALGRRTTRFGQAGGGRATGIQPSPRGPVYPRVFRGRGRHRYCSAQPSPIRPEPSRNGPRPYQVGSLIRTAGTNPSQTRQALQSPSALLFLVLRGLEGVQERVHLGRHHRVRPVAIKALEGPR